MIRIFSRLLLALVTSLLLAWALPAASQGSSPFPVTLEKDLAARAVNFTEVSLDKNMLAFASKFLDSKKSDDAQVRRLIEKLDGIYVRTYEFDKAGQYSEAELDAIRHQFSSPVWSVMVRGRAQDPDGDTDIYVKLATTRSGVTNLNAEPKELDFVYISGPIRPEELSELSGNFGVPKLGKNATGKESDK
jgi:hypothetical protein